MGTRKRGSGESSGEQQLRDAAQALAEAAGQLGHSFGAVGNQAESGVTKGLLAAAEALAQASAWVEQRANPGSTRDQLLAQAARLFAERGFAGVSLVDIAQAAGFTKGAVYNHFGSKEQVFLASVRSLIERLRAGASLADEAGSDSTDVVLTHRDLASAATLGIEAMLFGRRAPEHRAEVRDLVADLIPTISDAAATLPDDTAHEKRVLAQDETEFALRALRALLAGITDPDS